MKDRIKRVNQLIKKELFRIITKEADFSPKVCVTLTKTETSVDLSHAKIYISVLPEDKSDQVLKLLQNQIYQFQKKLNKRLNMRPVPKIYFTKEKDTATAGRIEQIFEQIKKEERQNNGRVAK